MSRDWLEYYEITKNKPPSKLLVKALSYVNNRGKAIDIGAGALKDAKYLLGEGFNVTAMDSSELMAREAEKIVSEKFHYFVSSFADFNFPEEEFDIASAMYALPFNAPKDFTAVFSNIKNSLKNGGIFCGQLFGNKDGWNDQKEKTFHTKEQAKKLLEGMEVLLFEEEENDSTTANGTPKHWHIFHVIARKV